MPGCALTKSIGLLNCGDSKAGGMSELLLAVKENVISVTKASGLISAIEMLEATQFYRYYFRKKSATFTDVYTQSDTGGSSFVPQLVFDISALTADNRNELLLLTKTNTVAIAKLNSGKYIYLGAENGLDVSTMTPTSGAIGTDFSGYQAITLIGDEPEPHLFVDPAIIAALLAPAPAP